MADKPASLAEEEAAQIEAIREAQALRKAEALARRQEEGPSGPQTGPSPLHIRQAKIAAEAEATRRDNEARAAAQAAAEDAARPAPSRFNTTAILREREIAAGLETRQSNQSTDSNN